ncbi:LysE family translocator [Oryzibacter oryziterrae]|uniref:LysE family translocator n=1 Tax=Oryzibacter oryziterrae TaxID=2766474 RepID=UPI001F01C7FF|nr:LysE family transporter [Oryzibacter oryziterrae]
MVTLAFVTTSLVLLLTPGPTNTMLATCGATLRFRHAALMPFAEAIGYVIAISFFFALATIVHGNPMAYSVMKLLAASWLAYSAVKLWRTPFEAVGASPVGAFGRVFLTTILNPKAMIVGTLFIPAQPFASASAWIVVYALLSISAGFGWVFLGAMLPAAIRRHSYKGAAVVLTGFSIAAVASVVG